MLLTPGYPKADEEVAGLLHGAGERLLAAHDLPWQRHRAALDLLLRGDAGARPLEQGGLRLQAELLIRAHWACGTPAHTATARRDLETVVAAFAAVLCALEVLDERADGDEPAADLGLALLGASLALFRGLPAPLGSRLLARWGVLWTRCAAARSLDAALWAWPDLTVSQAIRVAASRGLVTQWAAEAGATSADAAPALMTPLADFGRSLGTAHTLLHDLPARWPGAHRSGDLCRPGSGNPALAGARDSGLAPTEVDPGAHDGDVLRRRRAECGARDYARACADQYRRHAADALRRFAGAGGDPAPLAGLLDLAPELHVVQMLDLAPELHVVQPELHVVQMEEAQP